MTKSLAVQGEGGAVAAPSSESGALMAALVAKASDPSFDADKMAVMIRSLRELREDEAKAEFNRALAEMQIKLPRITKDGHVKYPSSKGGDVDFKFATEENIDKAIRPLMAEYGFSFSFDSEPTPDKVIYIGTLHHKLGHSKTARLQLPADTSGGKNAIQAVGSTASYARRYLRKALLNLIEEGEDNDGNVVGFLEEREVNNLIDMCAACDEFKPTADQESMEQRLLKAYKVKSFSDIQRKKYQSIFDALQRTYKRLREGGVWRT
jgi:hypothetical protein